MVTVGQKHLKRHYLRLPIPFEDKMKGFMKELSGQMEDEKKLNKEIRQRVSIIGFNLERI
jgi:hypothetical protein